MRSKVNRIIFFTLIMVLGWSCKKEETAFISYPQTAESQSVTVQEDTKIKITINEAHGYKNETLRYRVEKVPIHGELRGCMNLESSDGETDRTCTYTPAENYFGVDFFSYKVYSNNSNSIYETAVDIKVENVNDLPVIGADQEFDVAEDEYKEIILSKSYDVDGDILNFVLATDVTHGQLINCMNLFGTTGAKDIRCYYKPDLEYSGEDFFEYLVNDGIDSSIRKAKVSLKVINVNDFPILAENQSFSAAEGSFIEFTIKPAIDPEGSDLIYKIIKLPENGTLTGCWAVGSSKLTSLNCTYTPDTPDTFGDTTLVYTASDGRDNSTSATINLSITPINDGPVVANNQTFEVTEDQAFNFTVNAATDVDSLNLEYLFGPQLAVTSVGKITNCMKNVSGSDGASDLSCTYTPDSNYVGTVAFVYKVSDGSLFSGQATLTFNISAENDAPTIGGPTIVVSGEEDTDLAINLTAGSDVEGDSLTYSLVIGPLNGTLSNCLTLVGSTGNNDLSCIYSPNANVNGSPADTFTYKVNDGALDSNIMTVQVHLSGIVDLAEQVDTFSQNGNTTINKVDIVWVVDDSGSMGNEQANLATSFNSFINIFTGQQDIDINMAITTTSCERDGSGGKFKHMMQLSANPTDQVKNQFITDFKSNIEVGIYGSGYEQAFGCMQKSITAATNATFFRDDAILVFILVSDEMEQTPGDVDDHILKLVDFKGGNIDMVKVYSIYNSYVKWLFCNKACANRWNLGNRRFADIAQATGGLTGKITDADFSATLNDFGVDIFNALNTFKLSQTFYAGAGSSIMLSVNGLEVERGVEWDYDLASNSIIFKAGYLPAVEAEITVTYKYSVD